MPDPIPLSPRRDDTAADVGSLVRLGREEPPPVPAPTAPAPGPPGDDADAATLKAALLDAGITTTAEDQAAVQALARLDTTTVEAVARWVKTKKKPDTK
ncbi:hypothetical protein [Streptomyces resistomycificus]|uniref:Uncharacterized protein n=1 Tax=Streptomyces resistomycificus TaxID=67356 RepID=A0A0L8L4X8_9ACTN|nr:hypothetical protein [Streptomyces resistomycificus]KOG33278.1 hypothetical protein ADK37_23080 [Streptomyces resistomycificus]KUN99474.1 hypothetical protein AQJ84_11030 [Streptomyces resistomycificus]